MAKVTPGYRLYLYQLLVREVGVGVQTLLPQVEEVLAADGIKPVDLECETVQELVEACPDFLKLTVFKKGRVYATLLRREDWDQLLSDAADNTTDKQAKRQASGPKSWKKRKKGGKANLKPVKPGKRRREREAAERAEAEARAAAKHAEAAQRARERAADDGEASSTATVTEPAAATVAEPEPAVVATEPERVAPVADGGTEAAPEQTAPAPTPEDVDASASEQTAAPAPTPEPPAAPAPAPISLTVTYDPYDDMERELARQRRERQAADAQDASTAVRADKSGSTATSASPTPSAPVAPAAHALPAELPQDFGAEVACTDALLRALYQLLPYDVDPLTVLDEDWRVARSTGDLAGSRSRVSFPLRYLHEDGSPLTVTLRRTARSASGKRWSLALVDGDDGSGATHDSVGFEGLPAADEGAWSDLSERGAAQVNPVRELAQELMLGSWERTLGSLATMAAPERWNYPGEGVGQASRYGILREYLACTFHRARCQERVSHASDGSFAAFDTGLLTPFGEDLYACLTPLDGDIPWKLAGFATAGSGDLGARLAATIAELPEPPSYLSTVESVVPAHGRMVILDHAAILTRQIGRLPRAFLAERLEGNAQAMAILAGHERLSAQQLTDLARLAQADGNASRRMRRSLDDAVRQAMVRVRASYRLAVPVYDPAENRTKLLVPLCLVEDGRVDCALVLDLQPSGAYRAATVLSLPRAYACARVISREQPSWLTAERALG